jgi:hypothetical protein
MPRKSRIEFRELIGLVPKSKMNKAQRDYIDKNELPPDEIEWYFGRKCAYWKLSKINI